MVDPRVVALVVSQDQRSSYVGRDGMHCQLYVSESLMLRIDQPTTISAAL